VLKGSPIPVTINYYKFYVKIIKIYIGIHMKLPQPAHPVIRSIAFTMINPAAFIALWAYTYSIPSVVRGFPGITYALSAAEKLSALHLAAIFPIFVQRLAHTTPHNFLYPPPTPALQASSSVFLLLSFHVSRCLTPPCCSC
jgi:hypothetical protein